MDNVEPHDGTTEIIELAETDMELGGLSLGAWQALIWGFAVAAVVGVGITLFVAYRKEMRRNIVGVEPMTRKEPIMRSRRETEIRQAFLESRAAERRNAKRTGSLVVELGSRWFHDKDNGSVRSGVSQVSTPRGQDDLPHSSSSSMQLEFGDWDDSTSVRSGVTDIHTPMEMV